MTDRNFYQTGHHKPYSQWTPEEKTQVSLDLLATLRNKPKECSTANPGPMPMEQMQLLYQVYRGNNQGNPHD